MHGSPLRLGALVTLATVGIAAILGLIAVLDADEVAAGFGTGLGIAFVTFLVGGTIVCALACLGRRRFEIVSLGSVVAAGLALDMLVLAIWLEIDNEAYGKIAGVAFVWSFFALIALGLTLAVSSPGRLARPLYLSALAATIGAALISAWLIVTAGDEPVGVTVEDSSTFPFGPEIVGDDALLRALGVALVLLSALWFATIAADRLERSEAGYARHSQPPPV